MKVVVWLKIRVVWFSDYLIWIRGEHNLWNALLHFLNSRFSMNNVYLNSFAKLDFHAESNVSKHIYGTHFCKYLFIYKHIPFVSVITWNSSNIKFLKNSKTCWNNDHHVDYVYNCQDMANIYMTLKDEGPKYMNW